jgi:AcrR family transcriptional regulator
MNTLDAPKSVTAPVPESERRVYRSPRRQRQAAETRAAVLSAAVARFGSRGWSATGMRDVAAEAGVSVETVYATVGSKAGLLLAAIDVGVVGDVEPVPLAQRPEFARLGVGSFTDRVATAARLLTGINQRIAGLHRALVEAGRHRT